jgi:toxin ParE1/3/4
MKVRYTPSAAKELDKVLTYISDRSPQGAAKVKARIKGLISLIAAHPHIGAITADPGIGRMNALPYPYLNFLRSRKRGDRHPPISPHGAKAGLIRVQARRSL